MPDSLAMRMQPLREARRQWLARGEVAPGLIEPALLRSWERSRCFGLAATGRPAGAPHASAAQLARAIELRRELLAHARPMMEFLADQTQDAGGMVILADAQGMVLHALGDATFADRAGRVALRPGANWSERWRGTNAIGTALADEAAVVVHAGEHYLERNGFLTCTAAPITGPDGRVQGVLDISGDHRGYHLHTLALVRSTARMIEHKLFDTRHAGGISLRLHEQREGVGTVAEGLLALSEDGWLVGANGAALAMLGIGRADIGALTIDRVLQVDIDALLAWSAARAQAPHCLRRVDGTGLWARVEGGRALAAHRPHPPAASRPLPTHAQGDALAKLDTGDSAMHAAVDRARRVLDKPIALLLRGESGTGKEVFARAIHASGARCDAPFVAVNCAALPESLIEAELFGYQPGAYTGAGRNGAPGRIREAHGGTLFLDEIGDMPVSLQSRLLRVLQDRQVQPLGGGKATTVDFRLVCATHRDLHAAMAQGLFREDLYYRLEGLALQLPPLREREDQLQLVQRMLREFSPGREMQVAAELAQAFAGYRWPGNLRQLDHALRTACAMLDDDEDCLDWHHLSDELARELRSSSQRPRTVDEEADLRTHAARQVKQVVEDCRGNMSQAARRLGISRNTLYRKLRALSA